MVVEKQERHKSDTRKSKLDDLRGRVGRGKKEIDKRLRRIDGRDNSGKGGGSKSSLGNGNFREVEPRRATILVWKKGK